jgi:hypothetical protein
MDEVTGPVVAVALVLCAVFVPCTFVSGITGEFFRVGAVPDVLIGMDGQCSIRLVNPGVRAVFGLEPEEVEAIRARVTGTDPDARVPAAEVSSTTRNSAAPRTRSSPSVPVSTGTVACACGVRDQAVTRIPWPASIVAAACPIGPQTWTASLSALGCALAAAAEAAAGRSAYALCRPPGHHAYAGRAGGHCYINNSALAVQRLRDAGARRVAVLDIDSHHGNGTQGIFWEREDVLTISLHADPTWSSEHWDTPVDEVHRALLDRARPGRGDAEVVESQVKRWRFATPRSIWPEATWSPDDVGTLALAGDAFAGPRVEGAAVSGLAAAAALLG